MFSLVAFVGDSTFKAEMPKNVTQGGGYIRFIKSHTAQRLSEAEVQDVVEKIQSGRLAASFRTHREHTAHVKDIVARKDSEPRCPKCQGKLVQRIVKRGQNAGKEFLGCKGFPKCRGVVDASLLQ